MAGHRGIEPLLLDLESNVLPLTLMTCGASEEARTLDLLLGKQMFYQLNYTRIGSPSWTRTSDKVINSHLHYHCATEDLVGVTGFEPVTTWTQTMHSTRLNYTPSWS